jgi:hypothetical protein
MEEFEAFPSEALPALSALAKHCAVRLRDDWRVKSPLGVLTVVLAVEHNLKNAEPIGYPAGRVFDDFCDLCITGKLVTYAISYPAPPRGGVFVLPPDRWNLAMPRIDFCRSEVTIAGTRYLVRFLDRDIAETWIASRSQRLTTELEADHQDRVSVLKRAVPEKYKKLKDSNKIPNNCTGIHASRIVAKALQIEEGGKGWEAVLRAVRVLHKESKKVGSIAGTTAATTP